MRQLHPGARRLIEEASAADLPAPGADERIWKTLSQRFDAPLSGAAHAAMSGAGSQAAAALTTGVSLKLVAGLVAATVAGGGGWLWAAQREPGALAMQGAAPTAVYAPQRSATETVSAVSEPPPTAASRATPDAPARASGLGAEARLLGDAQRALSAGDATRALALIDRHRARFPKGALAPEREAARVFALCALGRIPAAQRAQRDFVRAWPSSPLTPRVRGACSNEAAR